MRVMPLRLALTALSSPTESAALLRALLERCVVDAHDHSEDAWDGECDKEIVTRGDATGVHFSDYEMMTPVPSVPALVLALLRLAPGDRDGALAALRGAS